MDSEKKKPVEKIKKEPIKKKNDENITESQIRDEKWTLLNE